MQRINIKQDFETILEALKLWWHDWANQVLVCLAAILASLTIILYPAAIFGIYEQALDLTDGVRSGLIGFIRGFKKYFKQNLVWGLINTFVLGLISLNIWFYANTKYPFAVGLVVFSVILMLVWLAWQFFSISCFFLQQEKSMKLAWKNGFAVMVINPIYSFIIALFMLLLLGLSLRFFIPLALGSPALISILGVLAVKNMPQSFSKS